MYCMWTSIRNWTIIEFGVKSTPSQKNNKKELKMTSNTFNPDLSRRVRGASLPDSRLGFSPAVLRSLHELVGRRELGSRR